VIGEAVSHPFAWLCNAIAPGLSANRKLSPNLNPEVVAEANLRIARISLLIPFLIE
jgi:hypothetical protein